MKPSIVAALVVAGATLSAPPTAHAAPAPTCHGQPATMVGTAGPDRLRGTAGDDVIVALGGNDLINALAGDDLVCGGDGADRIAGGAGDDVLDGQRDQIGSDRGGTFKRPDVIAGGPGDDLIDVGADRRRTDQGGLNGWVTYNRAMRPVRVDLAGASGTASGEGTDRIVWVPAMGVEGSRHDDHLVGGPRADLLVGGRGDDVIAGRGGRDELVAETEGGGQEEVDDDVLDGGGGADRIVTMLGGDVVHGGPGDDQIATYSDRPTQLYGDAGDDTMEGVVTADPGSVLDGGEGRDRGYLGLPAGAHRSQRPGAPVVVRVAEGTVTRSGVQAGTIADLEALDLSIWLRWVYYGTDGPDVVTGGSHHGFRAWTYGGDDDVSGTQRADRIDAGDGADVVRGYEGRDTCLNAETVHGCEVLTARRRDT